MTCYEDAEDDKNENGDGENKIESKKSLPREYSSVVEQVKIHGRTGSTLTTMDEIKERLKEHYLQLKREHGWSEDEMALNMKSSNNQKKTLRRGTKESSSKEGEIIVEHLGTRRLIVGT